MKFTSLITLIACSAIAAALPAVESNANPVNTTDGEVHTKGGDCWGYTRCYSYFSHGFCGDTRNRYNFDCTSKMAKNGNPEEECNNLYGSCCFTAGNRGCYFGGIF